MKKLGIVIGDYKIYLAALKWLVKALLAGIISLAILSLFTLVYSNSGVHMENPSEATDYYWKSGQFKSTMSEGFSWMHMNQDGFNNSFNLADYDDVDILLMGSSHMEAGNISQNENTGYLLNQLLDGQIVYNIGMSGHTIYHCVKNLKAAAEYYNPQSYVIIETQNVSLDEESMRKVVGGIYPQIPSYDRGMIHKIQEAIPAVLPIYRQIHNWKNSKFIAGTEGNSDRIEKSGCALQSYRQVLDRFLKFANKSANGRKVIIVYHPSLGVNPDGEYSKKDAEEVTIFKELCDRNGIIFVDMQSDFENLYKEQHVLPHGFKNTAVGIGHLNKHGHKRIADRIAAIIRRGQDVAD